MSSQIKKIAKEAGKLRFEAEMYSNFIGSYMIASYILNGKGSIPSMNRTYKRLKRNPDLIDLGNKDWLRTACDLFGVVYDLTGRIVMVQGFHNILFLIADDDGHIYPIREDGRYPFKSLEEALDEQTIYRVVDEEEQVADEEFCLADEE